MADGAAVSVVDRDLPWHGDHRSTRPGLSGNEGVLGSGALVQLPAAVCATHVHGALVQMTARRPAGVLGSPSTIS
jgi:hypothetical protein